MKAPETLSVTLQSREQKRKRGPVEDESNNRREGSSSPIDSSAIPIKRLTKKNLKELNRLNYHENPEVVDGMVGKRSRSKSGITNPSQDNSISSTPTDKTSLTLSNYRLINLHHQLIGIEHGFIPQQLQTRLDSIFQSDVSENDKREVATIAKSIRNKSINVLSVASREDDSVELFINALEFLNEKLLDEAFAMHRKAGKVPKPYKSYGKLT